MNSLRSLVLAFLTFSRFPMPRVDWKPESMRYVLCFFPLVGIAVGALVGLWTWASTALGLDAAVTALGITAVPLLASGGIHLDGFCDTLDAQASHADPARKRAILKDPHLGAFAAAGVSVYLLGYFSFASNVDVAALGVGRLALAFVCLHALSRALSAVATVAFPAAVHEGMLAEERQGARRPVVLCSSLAWSLAAAAGLVFVQPFAGAFMVLAALACLLVLRIFSARQFGGMSGDLAGCFLQVSELAMLVCLSVVTKVVL